MRRSRFTCIFLLFFVSSAFAKEPVDLQMITKLKQEGFKNSQVMDILSDLTDIYGPRLTGSTHLKKASEWARDQLGNWGLANAHLEAWGTFGRGWETERYSIEMMEPWYLNIYAHPKAWTPGTDGEISGQPVMITMEDDDFTEKFAGKLKGAIVMLSSVADYEGHFEAEATRLSDEELEEEYMAPDPKKRHGRSERYKKYMKWRKWKKKVNRFLVEEGAAAILESGRLNDGTIRVMSGGSYKTTADSTLPTLAIATEHYNLISRLLKKEIAVKLVLNIQNRFLDDDSLGYNVLAEIPGTDRKLKDQVVMIGAHIDSWHGATGTTDNGAGCAVMMEVMRILKAVGVKPRRTIRIGLWSGEELGEFGSEGYVKKHFGDRKTMQLEPEHEKFSAYYNIDNGTGKIRGIYLQGNDAARPFFEAMFAPFHDYGAETVTIRNTTSTDHEAFDKIGLPGFQFIQDPIDYFGRTWHTNMDFFDHAQESDLMQMSVIVASIVYHTAMREQKIPRKPLPESKD